MGGYDIYIWPAYGVAAVVMIGLLAVSIRASRVNTRALAELESSGRGRRRARRPERATKETDDDPQAS
jgi:heme exporter protein D